MSKSFTDGLRDRLIERCGCCPTCGHRQWNTLRALAKAMGTSPASLTRWLSNGKAPSAATIDRAVAYLNKEGK